MTRRDAEHWDVAAYALGILDHREVDRFEDHLAGCERCADELESLLPVTSLMADVDGAALQDAEQSYLGDRLISAVRFERRRAQHRQLLAVAAGAVALVLAAGVGAIVGARTTDGAPGGVVAGGPTPDSSPAAGPPGIGGPDLIEGEVFSATDAVTGLRADVVLQGNEWGTLVSFALAPLPGPLTGRLVLVHSDGAREIAATWLVPADGYGTATQPAPLMLQTVTSMSVADLDHLEIQGVSASGDVTTLVTVPL